MADDFADRFGPWALVTGASSGIGEQFARQLAARGLHLVITARRTALLQNLAADIKRQHGTQVEVLALDLTRPDFIEPLLNVCA